MYCEIVIVAFPGPPPVKFFTSSKSCKVPFVDMIAVRRTTGFNFGSVILKNVWTVEAPSILAAS